MGYGVVLVYGVQLVLFLWEDGGGDAGYCGGVVCGVGDVVVLWWGMVRSLLMQLVCVGKLACSQVCRLGVGGLTVQCSNTALLGFLVSSVF